MIASARVMVPVTITPAMILGGTSIAEPAASETVWTNTTYTVGQLRIVVAVHKEFECVVAIAAPTGVSPELDPTRWKEKGPTLRYAPFDDYSNTKASAVTSMTYVLQPGFINGLALYGLEGSAYNITVKDAPGGTVIKTYSGDLYAQALGWYELLYCPLLQLTQISFDDVPLSPTTEVTITITAGGTNRVAIGTIKVGDWRQFIGEGTFGGAQYGASSKRKSYSYREYNFDGTYISKRRANARLVSATVVIDAEQANYADAIIGEIFDTAVPFEASNLGRYAYLNTLGFIDATVSADNFGITSIKMTIDGNI